MVYLRCVRPKRRNGPRIPRRDSRGKFAGSHKRKPQQHMEQPPVEVRGQVESFTDQLMPGVSECQMNKDLLYNQLKYGH